MDRGATSFKAGYLLCKGTDMLCCDWWVSAVWPGARSALF